MFDYCGANMEGSNVKSPSKVEYLALHYQFATNSEDIELVLKHNSKVTQSFIKVALEFGLDQLSQTWTMLALMLDYLKSTSKETGVIESKQWDAWSLVKEMISFYIHNVT